MNMSDWVKMINYINTVPDARIEVIHHLYPSGDDQRRQGAQYYITVHPSATWEHLAQELYQFQQYRALKTFKDVLPKPKGNQCDCVECVGAVCSDSVHSAL